jgi:hypothetical protein
MGAGRVSKVGFVGLLSGCLYTPKAWEPVCYKWSCPWGSCTAHLSLDMDDVEACYGTSEGLPDILEDCADDWGQDACALTIPNIDGETRGGWVKAISEEDAQAECEARNDWTWAEADGEEQAEFDSLGYLMQDIQGDECTISFFNNQEPWLSGCAMEGDVEQEAECGEDERLTAPSDAEFEMRIDPALSWVDADLGAESVYVELDGSAFASTSPAEFLLALAWAEDFEYDDDSFTTNHAILSAAIDVNPSSGTYTVPVQQDFELVFQGLREGNEYVVTVDPSVASGGTFDPTGGEWSYHYSQTGSGTSVEIHLEGALMATSP